MSAMDMYREHGRIMPIIAVSDIRPQKERMVKIDISVFKETLLIICIVWKFSIWQQF